MKHVLLTVSAAALLSTGAHAQLLGGGGLGGSLGGTIDGTLNTTIDRTTQTVRGTVDGSVATQGDETVDARNGRVSTRRSANGSVSGSTASLADLAIPPLAGETSAQGSANANANGSADAQLIGTDAVTGTLAPVASRARNAGQSAAGRANGTATGLLGGASQLGGSASGEGSASGNAQGSILSSPLAVAGSAASQARGAATVSPGMPVVTPDGASLGKVREVVADGRGNVQQVVVKQGRVTRTLPAGMFSAQGGALVAGQASGQAASRAD